MRRELVQKVLRHNYPARIPMLYSNGHKEKSDILLVDVVNYHIKTNAGIISEWGFLWD